MKVKKKDRPLVFLTALTALVAVLLYFLYPQIIGYTDKSINQENSRYSIKVNYPAFQNQKINDNIIASIDKAMAEIKAEPPKPKDYPVDYKNTLVITYDRPYVTDRVISLYFEFFTYTGGAHPNTKIVTKNFNAKTGKMLTLADLCSTDKATLNKIKANIKGQFKNLLSEENPTARSQFTSWYSSGVDANKLETFTVNSNSITFYFQQYEVAPYASGPQKASLPLQNNRLIIQ
jgi:hypothetical protein